jgi:hypothetical protein
MKRRTFGFLFLKLFAGSESASEVTLLTVQRSSRDHCAYGVFVGIFVDARGVCGRVFLDLLRTWLVRNDFNPKEQYIHRNP